MAEIKSTIELVMERTKHLIQTPEERARANEQELESRAAGYLLKITEGHIQPEELPDLLDRTGEDAGPLRKTLLGLMIRGVGLSGDNEPILAGLRTLVGAAVDDEIAEIRELSSAWAGGMKKLTGDAGGQVIEELAAKGITGSAVKPKYASDPAYIEAREKLARDLGGKLDRVRAVILVKAS